MSDFIPTNDGQFAAWADNFMDYANGHLAELGLAASDLTDLLAMQADFNGKMAAHIAARSAAAAARQAKDDSRGEYKSAIRQLVRRLQVSSAVDDSEREALGITVADTIRTTNTAEITTRPVGQVDTSQRLRHTIRFADEATPTKRAKPKGVMGCEIWVKVAELGEPSPVDGGGLRFVFMDTAGRHIVEYESKDGGKMAHYMLRWVKKGGIKGPWSETISATITV